MTTRYPKINFIGNKEKISDWIIENLPITKGVILDLFCGGCSISFTLKQKNFRVFSNDILYSNYVLSKSIIENNDSKLKISIDDKDLEMFFDVNIYEKVKWLSNKLFFDYEVRELSSLLNYSNKLKNYDKYIFLSLLRRAMIRKIPYSRMNIKWEEIVKFRDEERNYQKYKRRRSYQNKSFLFHIKSDLENYNNSIFNNSQENKSFNYDCLKLLRKFEKEKIKVDLIYMDPPYPSTMNNYFDFYGAFDSMLNKHKKSWMDFTNKENFLKNMRELLIKSKNISNYVAISLNNKSKPSIEEIQKITDELNFKNKILRKPHIYKVSGKKNKNNNEEILLILENSK